MTRKKTHSRRSALDWPRTWWRPIWTRGQPWPILLGFFAGIALLSACQVEEVNVQGELTTYMDQARLWAATEAKINNAIASARKDQFVHDDFVLETMRPAIGVAREYVAELEHYEPKSPALAQVHQGYIESWRAHEFALVSVVDAVERQDYIQLSRANIELLEAQRSVSDALAALARLLRGAGLASDTPTEHPLAPPTPSQGFAIDPSS